MLIGFAASPGRNYFPTGLKHFFFSAANFILHKKHRMRITFLLIFVFSQQLVSGQLVYDTLLTETAKYIAGLPCETSTFQTLQQKSFYPGHQRFTNDSWQELSDSTLIPMVKWAQEKQILSSTDTGTCFYPFSGTGFFICRSVFSLLQGLSVIWIRTIRFHY